MVNGKANYNIHILHLQKTKKTKTKKPCNSLRIKHWYSHFQSLQNNLYKVQTERKQTKQEHPPPLSFLILTIFSQFVIKYNIKSRSQMLLLIRDGKWLFLKWPRKEQTKWTDKKNIDQVTNLITSRGYKSSILYEYLNLIKESFSYRKITQ